MLVRGMFLLSAEVLTIKTPVTPCPHYDLKQIQKLQTMGSWKTHTSKISHIESNILSYK